LREESGLAEFALGLQPIIKVAAWDTAPFKIDFVSAQPDLVVVRCLVRRIFCVRLNGICVNFQSVIPLALRCHSGDLSWLNCTVENCGELSSISAHRWLQTEKRYPYPCRVAQCLGVPVADSDLVAMSAVDNIRADETQKH